GAVCTNDAQNGGVGGNALRCSLTTFGATERVFTGQFDGAAEQLTTAIINGNFDRTAGVIAQVGRSSRDCQHISNVDRLIGSDLNAPDLVDAFKSSGFSSRFLRRFICVFGCFLGRGFASGRATSSWCLRSRGRTGSQ